MTYTITYKTSSGGTGSVTCSFASLKDVLSRLDYEESIAAYCVEDLNTQTDLAKDIPELNQNYRKLKCRKEL